MKWSRSQAPLINPGKDDLAFQQIDVDHYIDSPLAAFKRYPGATPITRLFGVTMEGHSVLCHVHGFRPYFYIQAPNGFRDEDLARFMVCFYHILLHSID